MAIEDPKQRITYIRHIASLAASLKKPGDLSLAVDNLKGDVANIADPSLRSDAERIWRIIAAIDEGYSASASTALKELADLLEARDAKA